jgi:hypothetical protein
MKRLWKRAALMVAGAALAFPGMPTQASSHSDAPLIKLDPQANLTDVYAFIRTGANNVKFLVVEVSVRPFSEPGDGVMYEAFADDALYSIHIADPNTGAQLQRYDFKFSPVGIGGNYKNLNTILRYGRGANIGGSPDAGAIMDVGDAHQNFVQTYTLTRTVGGSTTVLSTDVNQQPLLVPPANTGARTTPFYNDTTGTPATNPNYGFAVSGASSRATLDRYTRETTYNLNGGLTTFCGLREDGFYADTPGIFDLLDPRILLPSPTGTFGQTGNGVDGFKGFNVLHYSVVIPVSQLPAIQYQAPFTGGQSLPGIGSRLGVGVYASVSRPRITLRSASGPNSNSGPYIQVNREANPLFNEVLVAIADKDNYNRDSPTNDAARYKTYALNPEVAALINAVYGTSFATSGRVDLAAVYIPDVIRVDTTTGAARVAGEAGFSRLGFIGGDTITTSGGVAIPGGWPNGRRLGDDVVDIALTAIASGPTYSTVTLVGDNVDHNDQVYNTTFPYAGTPHAGTRHRKDSDPEH